MPIPLNLLVYERGANGVPSTTYLTDLGGRAASYEHTISDRFGFESCRITMSCTAEEGLDWLQNGLMRSLIVTGPNAEICWEGYLETVALTLGQKKASLSVKGMANNVHFLFTSPGGYPGDAVAPATAASAQSQALYGRKDYCGTLSQIFYLAVLVACAKALAALCLPRSAEATSAASGDLGTTQLELTFTGWYGTLDWMLASNASPLNVAAHTQLTTTLLPGEASIHGFLSTNYSGVTYTGPIMPEFIAHYATYKQAMEKLLSVGDSGNNPLAYGVYENRAFQAVVSAAATPTTITYREDAGSGQVLDTYGNVVAPWNVRPNAMSEIVQLLDVGPVAGATDAAARKYVGRVTCAISGDQMGCTLEPSGASGLDALVAAFPAYHERTG